MVEVKAAMQVRVALAVGVAFLSSAGPALPSRGDVVDSSEVVQPLTFYVTVWG
jgi:hypothetical protein